MGAAAVQHSFSGHETFPCRYPWLKKGFDAVRDDGDVFLRDDAVTILGVGKNMVRSIRHWCLAAGVIADNPDAGPALRTTEFGRQLLADDGLDPYLEDPATLWLLHWQIAGNRGRATTWFWAFSYFHEPEFTREALTSALLRWTQTLPGKAVAESSLKRDLEVFLRTYVPSRQGRGNLVEDSLDCPLVELGLITQPAGGPAYRFRRGAQAALPDGILLYAVLRFWTAFAPNAETLAIHDLARQPGSPGRLFKIDESSLVERLEHIEQPTDGALVYAESVEAIVQTPRIALRSWTRSALSLILGTISRNVFASRAPASRYVHRSVRTRFTSRSGRWASPTSQIHSVRSPRILFRLRPSPLWKRRVPRATRPVSLSWRLALARRG